MKKLIQIILAVVIVGLVYIIYDQISTPIRFEQELKDKKALVIDRIKDIRTAERAFRTKYQRFTGSFDTLVSFVLNDSLVLERKIVDEDDSVAMAMLKKSGRKNVEQFTVAVIDTIFSPKKLTAADVEQFRFIPGTDDKAQFILALGAVTIWFRALNTINIVGVLRSGGDTLFSLCLDVGTLWLVGVSSTGLAALVFHWPLEWVYACTFLEEAVKMAVGIPHFRKRQWMNVLTQQPEG